MVTKWVTTNILYSYFSASATPNVFPLKLVRILLMVRSKSFLEPPSSILGFIHG